MATSKGQTLAISGKGVFGKVANYSALPAANLHDGETWICLASQGTPYITALFGGTYYPSGQYYSTGSTWLYDSTAYQASQSAVNAGLITDQWVSPNTLSNSDWAFTVAKVLATVLTGLSVATGGVITSSDTILQALGKLQYQLSNIDLSAYLTKANNLSDLASNKTARVNLGLDKGTNGGNAAYNILLTDKTVYTGTAFTAPRVWTLPDASTVNPFYEILVIDSLQTITSTNTLTIGVQSGQYLNGVLNGTEVIQSAGGWRRLISNGTNNWTFDAGIVRQNKAQTLSNKTLDSTNVGVTQTAGDNSTKLATTAYVDNATPPAAKLFNYYNFS